MNKNSIHLLTLLKVASIAKKHKVIVPFNKINIKILNSLYTNGIIQNFIQFSDLKSTKKYLIVQLRFFFHMSTCSLIKIISKPSLYYYLSFSDLCLLFDKRQLLFLSTTAGILTSVECKQKKLGGIILFKC
jgi:ribosomal protein S8